MPILKPTRGSQIVRGHPLARGLVGAWAMNEGGGRVTHDLSGHGSHGTLTGDAVNWVAGPRGPAIDFGGTSDYILCPSAGALNVSSLTVLATFNPSLFYPSTFHGIVARYNTGATARVWFLGTNGATLNVYIGNSTGSSGALQATGPNLSYGTWYEIIFAFQAGIGITGLWVNGEPISFGESQTNTSLNVADPGQALEIGSYNAGVSEIVGQMDCVAIWNRALVAGEVAQLQREPFGMFRPNIIEIWTPSIVSAATYAGTGAATADKATASASGTFTVPVYAGTGAATADKATASASGTFSVPVYAGTGSATADKATASASGTFTVPVYAGTGAATADKATASASGTFAVPVYAGTGAATADKAMASASGTFTVPVYAGTGSATVDKAMASASGTFTVPMYAGTGSATVDKATASASGTFAVPVYAGTGSATVGKATASASGTFAVPVYAGTGSATAGKATASASGLYGLAIYKGVGSASFRMPTAQSSGLFTPPVYSGSGASSVSTPMASADGTFAGAAAAVAAAAFIMLKRRY